MVAQPHKRTVDQDSLDDLCIYLCDVFAEPPPMTEQQLATRIEDIVTNAPEFHDQYVAAPLDGIIMRAGAYAIAVGLFNDEER